MHTAFKIEVQNRFNHLPVEGVSETTPEEDWETLQKVLIETSERIIPKKEKIKKQQWMTDEIISLMKNRRTQKHRSFKTYREIDKKIRIKCKEAKEKWINEQCKELEDLENRDIQIQFNSIQFSLFTTYTYTVAG